MGKGARSGLGPLRSLLLLLKLTDQTPCSGDTAPAASGSKSQAVSTSCFRVKVPGCQRQLLPGQSPRLSAPAASGSKSQAVSDGLQQHPGKQRKLTSKGLQRAMNAGVHRSPHFQRLSHQAMHVNALYTGGDVRRKVAVH
eukprot:167128-Chlamydomonas_euryale.AAC.6